MQQQIDAIPSVTVDSALSDTSENPVQNKAITSKINQMDRQLGALDTAIDSTLTESGKAADAKAALWTEVAKP